MRLVGAAAVVMIGGRGEGEDGVPLINPAKGTYVATLELHMPFFR